MTNAEVKVKELVDALLGLIYRCEEDQESPERITLKVKAYLNGVADGIEFCEEVRRVGTPASG